MINKYDYKHIKVLDMTSFVPTSLLTYMNYYATDDTFL